ncbi:MAG: helix-turn-helix domain-containing protein [Desulfovibrio sp.]|nr:helix-turn-helix domain-containing protein [Desulfovibrio sp.]
MNLGVDLIKRHLVAEKAAGRTGCMATLAAEAGIGRATLGRYVSGENDLQVGKVAAILHAIGYQLVVAPLSADLPSGTEASWTGDKPAAEQKGLGDLLRAASAAGYEVRLVPAAHATTSATHQQERKEPTDAS